VEVKFHVFLTLALGGGEQSASCPSYFTLGTHLTGGWVDPRAGLDTVAKRRKHLPLSGIEPQLSSPQFSHYID